MNTAGEDISGGGPEQVSRAPAVARAAAILRLLSKEREGLGVNEIARKVGLVPSTCLHILRALVEEGFVAVDPTRKTYRTAIGLVRLVRDSLASSGFQGIAQPHLDRLAATYNVTAVALELDNLQRMVVVAIARAASFVSLHVAVGSRFPAMVSATGRCIAAASGLGREELRSRFAGLPWEDPPSFEDWYESLDQVRADRVAIDAGRYVRGITVLATLLDAAGGTPTRGLALIGLQHQMTGPLRQALETEILTTASAVSAALG